ncbi:MAG: hypothetical protein U0792_25535 [Gemmataceae bacterium]
MNRSFTFQLRSPLSLATLAAGLTLAAVGCGKSKPVEVPVSGRVIVNGKPATGATVVLHPVNAAPDAAHPTARVDEKGEFVVAVPETEKQHAAGEYRVTLTWFVSTAGKYAQEGDERPLWNQLPAKYSKIDTTPISTTVKPEGTEPISIDIKVPNGRQ